MRETHARGAGVQTLQWHILRLPVCEIREIAEASGARLFLCADVLPVRGSAARRLSDYLDFLLSSPDHPRDPTPSERAIAGMAALMRDLIADWLGEIPAEHGVQTARADRRTAVGRRSGGGTRPEPQEPPARLPKPPRRGAAGPAGPCPGGATRGGTAPAGHDGRAPLRLPAFEPLRGSLPAHLRGAAERDARPAAPIIPAVARARRRAMRGVRRYGGGAAPETGVGMPPRRTPAGRRFTHPV
jgi:hypothetical protein